MGQSDDTAQKQLAEALAHHQRGDLAAAEAMYTAVVAASPRHFDALHFLGVLRHQQGRNEIAAELIERAIEVRADVPDAHASLGVVYIRLERFSDALASFDRALALAPHEARVLYDRANALRQLDRNEEALADYDRSLALDPNRAEAHYNRGNALRDLDRHAEALASYDRALAIKPDYAEALNNRGNALRSLRRYDAAVASFDRALALRPKYAEALNNRGNALRDVGRVDEALACYDRALIESPAYPDALHNRANVLRETKRFEEAVVAFERLLSIAPDYDYALGEWMTCRMQACIWDDFQSHVQAITTGVLEGRKVAAPFVLKTVSDSAAAQLACARTYIADRHPPKAQALWRGEIYRHAKPRIAYLCGNFYMHAISVLTVGLFEAHDRTRFDVSGVAYGPRIEDTMRGRIERAFEHFTDASRMSDAEVARLLREQEIDIAIDLNGLADNARPGILAHRAAPVQVAYLGHLGTMGADYIDYVVADPWIVPAEHEEHFSEKIVRLPDTVEVEDAQRPPGPSPARNALDLPDDAFVFCCFNNSYKITPEMFDIWMRLLNAVDGSVLWLLGDNAAASRNLRREAERRGVSAERLVFAKRAERVQHLARQACAALFLDTLPVNAGITASDALWAGLPVVTCQGGAAVARIASSVVNAAGVPELVTRNLAEYEALALELARNTTLLAEFRTRLLRDRDTCALFDTPRFCRHIESAYAEMWERYRRGKLPESFDVQASG